MQLTNDQISNHFPALVVVVKSGGVRARPGYKAAELYRELQPRYTGILAQQDRVSKLHPEDAEARARELEALGTVVNTISAKPFLVDELEGIVPVSLTPGAPAPEMGQLMISLGPLVVDSLPAEG